VKDDRKYFGNAAEYHMTQEEVAKALGLHRMTVQKIEKNALKKLKAMGKLQRFVDAKE
jgi:DNA-directed RNA polymerase sigma subunit (sigma70/sigma32)